MGQEQSFVPFDPSIAPTYLRERNLQAVATYILSGSCRNVVFMVGAGISTSAGIPDFRSPNTGLYSQLSNLDLPRPEAIFDISFFRENPYPFYMLARELWPGVRYKPTKTHLLMRLLNEKNLLGKVYTQNIDTLELAAGVPKEKIVFAHGSFEGQSCIDCKLPADREEMEKAVMEAEPMKCIECGGLVKPNITFFGESLGSEFHDSLVELETPVEAGGPGLVLVMGSSLSVYPFATLPQLVSSSCPRLLINQEEVGELGNRSDDVIWLGDCDKGVEKLVELLGWQKEMEKLWEETRGEKEEEFKGTEDERVELEVARLVADVDKGLKIAEEHKERSGKSIGLGHVFPHMEEKDRS